MNQSNETVPALTMGVDLSDRSAVVCAIDATGQIIERSVRPTTREAIVELGAGPPCRMVIEASTHAPWVARELTDLGHEVIVANPRAVHLISKSSKKTDANDAEKLARLGRVDPDLLSPVHLRTEKNLVARSLLGARRKLVGTRTALISMVRTESKVFGKPITGCSSESFAKRARLALPDELRLALEPILDVLESLTKTIADYDRKIVELGESDHPETALLRQVHGVGHQVALAFVATIGDPRRFSDSRNVGAYAGLVPRSYQSGDRDPNLRITKQGDGMLRTLLVNSASHILRRSSPDSALKRFGQRIASRGNPRDKARARIAVARKLAVLLHRLWLTGEVYEPMRGVPTTA